MKLVGALGVAQKVANKDIELLGEGLIDVALEGGQSIGKAMV